MDAVSIAATVISFIDTASKVLLHVVERSTDDVDVAGNLRVLEAALRVAPEFVNENLAEIMEETTASMKDLNTPIMAREALHQSVWGPVVHVGRYLKLLQTRKALIARVARLQGRLEAML
jgi:hypothetical protein